MVSFLTNLVRPSRAGRASQGDTQVSVILKLLVIGVTTSGIVSLVVAMSIWLIGSGLTAISFGAGAGVSLVAMAGSLAFLAIAWRLPPQASLIAALTGFGLAFVGVMVFLGWIETSGGLEFISVGVGLVVSAFSFATSVVLSYRRLRIPVFSTESEPITDDKDNPH